MRYILSLIISFSFLKSDIHVFNRSSGTESEIKVLPNVKPIYVSAKDLGESFTSKIYENSERQKLVLYIAGSKIKVSGNSSYVIINDNAYQMPQVTIIEGDDLYVPAEYFFEIIKGAILPGINFDSNKELLEIDIIRFNVTNISIDVKSNGTIIH